MGCVRPAVTVLALALAVAADIVTGRADALEVGEMVGLLLFCCCGLVAWAGAVSMVATALWLLAEVDGVGADTGAATGAAI